MPSEPSESPALDDRPPEAPYLDLSDPEVRKTYQKHRWVVMVLGAGTAIISVSLLLGLIRATEEGGLGGLCLLFLLLILMAFIGTVFYIITFATAAIIGLRGKGKPAWLRLMGILPILVVLVAAIGGQAIFKGTEFGDGDSSAGFFFAGLWIGVCIIFFNAALIIPKEHATSRKQCLVLSWLPLLSLAVLALDLASDQTLWVVLLGPPLVAGFVALAIFMIMKRVMEHYPYQDMMPIGPQWHYPR